MSEININLLGDGSCKLICKGSKIITNTPIEFGGKGKFVSSTDLLAAALGTCIATSIEQILSRNNFILKEVYIIITKELSIIPKKIKTLDVQIIIEKDITEELRKKLITASKTCLIGKSINVDYNLNITTNVN